MFLEHLILKVGKILVARPGCPIVCYNGKHNIHLPQRLAIKCKGGYMVKFQTIKHMDHLLW